MAGDGVAYQWDDRAFQQMLKETIEKPNFDSSMYEILFHTIAELRRILRAR